MRTRQTPTPLSLSSSSNFKSKWWTDFLHFMSVVTGLGRTFCDYRRSRGLEASEPAEVDCEIYNALLRRAATEQPFLPDRKCAGSYINFDFYRQFILVIRNWLTFFLFLYIPSTVIILYTIKKINIFHCLKVFNEFFE